MPVNLVELSKNYFNDDVVKEAAALVNEDSSVTRSAINKMIPVFLSGLSGYELPDRSGQSALDLITGGPINTGMLNDLASIFNNKENVNRLTQYGDALLQKIYNERLSNITFDISKSNGIHLASAKTLFSLVATTVVGILNNHESIVGLSGKELLEALAGKETGSRSPIQQKFSAMEKNSPPPAGKAGKPKSNLSWLGWLIVLVVIVFLIGYLMKGCNHTTNTSGNSDTTNKPQVTHSDTTEKPSDTSGENPY
jgi:Bacterial protein of unknown function (DUF937)